MDISHNPNTGVIRALHTGETVGIFAIYPAKTQTHNRPRRTILRPGTTERAGLDSREAALTMLAPACQHDRLAYLGYGIIFFFQNIRELESNKSKQNWSRFVCSVTGGLPCSCLQRFSVSTRFFHKVLFILPASWVKGTQPYESRILWW